MTFKDSTPEFAMVDLNLIDPDPAHVRQSVSEDGLKGLINAIQKHGLIHPLVVRPGAAGRYVVVVGERRRQAAQQAGLAKVPALIKPCSTEEALEVSVFENLGLGVRSALEPREMATAIQTIADRFATAEEAAQYFGRAPTWLSHATAAANLSEKVTALLDSGKISSTSAAVQLEKLAKKNEAKAESLIEQIEQMPEGEKVSKKVVDEVLQEESPRSKKKSDTVVTEAPDSTAAQATAAAATADALGSPDTLGATPASADIPPWEDTPAQAAPTRESRPLQARVNPGKVKLVAELLGLSDEDEELVLARLIDEFLALKQA